MLETVLHILVVLTVPPLLLGVIGRTKAAFAGRTGAPVLQPWYDLLRLVRKEMVLSTTTTWVFLAGPVLAVAAPLAASLLVPFGGNRAPVSFSGDLVLFAYLFALSRFFTAAAALDTGSAFEGMGAAREVSFACLAEPALFFGLLVLARISGTLSLSSMLSAPWTTGWITAGASLILVVAGWFVVLLAEQSRIPFDDPNTHLELTMIHEVMVLDHSGPAFGLILYGASLKLFVFSTLIAAVLLPRTGIPLTDAAATLGAVLLLGVVIGLVESGMARLRLVRVPQLLVTASLIAGFAVVLVLR